MSHERVRFVPFHKGVVLVSYLVSEKIGKTASRSLMILTILKKENDDICSHTTNLPGLKFPQEWRGTDSDIFPIPPTLSPPSPLTWNRHQEQQRQQEEKVIDPHGRQASRRAQTGWQGVLVHFIRIAGHTATGTSKPRLQFL